MEERGHNVYRDTPVDLREQSGVPTPVAKVARRPSREALRKRFHGSDGIQGSGFSSVEKADIPEYPAFARALAASTPSTLSAEERIRFQIEALNNTAAQQRAALRDHFNALIERMVFINASDMDLGGISSAGHVWYRINGVKARDQGLPKYSLDEYNVMILSLLTPAVAASLLDWKAADFSHQLDFIEGRRARRFRASAYMEMGYIALNMRAISNDLRTLASLSFHPTIEKGLKFRHERDGLTLITGVTGSGKSTTLDAIVDANNEDVEGHIVIIGKPIEYMHESKKCIVRHREVGQDVPTFKDGIVQALRQDPDIVVIGEMRDPKTISSTLEITDSGHKVFSTLHTSSAVESIARIIGEYPPEEQDRVRNRLADVLRCIISQKLCPRIGGGRILAKEVLWMTSPARAAIKNNNNNEIYQMMWEGSALGQMTLEQDLNRLMRQGLVSPDAAMNYANNKRRFQQLAAG